MIPALDPCATVEEWAAGKLPFTPGEVAEALGIDVAQVTAALDRLQLQKKVMKVYANADIWASVRSYAQERPTVDPFVREGATLRKRES